MADKFLLVFLLCFIRTTIEKEENNFKKAISDGLNSSSYIIPINNQNNYFYIITGENEKSNSSIDIYKMVILKYDLNSGKMINNFTFNSTFPFENPEVIFAGDNLEEYLLIITFNSIGLYDFKNYKETIYPTKGSRRFLKKGINLFYYGYRNPIKENEIRIDQIQLIKENIGCNIYEYDRIECGYLGIDQHTCESRGCCWKEYPLMPEIYDFPWCFEGEKVDESKYLLESPFYKLTNFGSDYNVVINQNMISCDFTQNYLYLVCVSISEDFFVISTYTDNLRLLNIYKKESFLSFQKDDFIKIINFKDTYTFVSLNSVNFITTRLRYFRYDGNYTSKLDSITNNENEYLDVDKTQASTYYYNNDIMALNNNSIIQISTEDNFIVISIYRFYENNNILFVKIYNIGSLYESGLNYISNPRLSLFKNSILVCFSALYSNINRTGFFIFDYPNSIDITLTSNIIKLKDLVSLPNKLFSLELKIKVLKIPKDFILWNKINHTEIEGNKVYDLTDEFILRQYRMKEGIFNIKFMGLAIGDDESYSNWRIYPEGYPDDRQLEPSKIYIEGEEGNIYINFSECFKGYYHLDYDYNLCTNIRPEGYYLDKETNTYRACHSHCSNCYGPPKNPSHMECITCKYGFNITEDTNSCYDYLPPHYYLDNNIFRRCHIRCFSCFNSPKNNMMNCLSCISSEYYYKNESHTCILPSEINKRKAQDLTKQSSWTFIVFFLIFLAAVIITLIISSNFFCKKKKNINKIDSMTELRGIN